MVAKTRGFEQRAQYYAAKAYGRQANSVDNDHNLKEVIFISIADHVISPDKAAYKSDHIILDKVSYGWINATSATWLRYKLLLVLNH